MACTSIHADTPTNDTVNAPATYDARMSNPLKGKVLRVFGLVIRPANWLIFIAGFLIMGLAPYLWVRGDGFIESLILFVTGLTLVVQGYGEVKDDEDVDPK